jgi:hypothetical protein
MAECDAADSWEEDVSVWKDSLLVTGVLADDIKRLAQNIGMSTDRSRPTISLNGPQSVMVKPHMYRNSDVVGKGFIDVTPFAELAMLDSKVEACCGAWAVCYGPGKTMFAAHNAPERVLKSKPLSTPEAGAWLMAISLLEDRKAPCPVWVCCDGVEKKRATTPTVVVDASTASFQFACDGPAYGGDVCMPPVLFILFMRNADKKNYEACNVYKWLLRSESDRTTEWKEAERVAMLEQQVAAEIQAELDDDDDDDDDDEEDDEEETEEEKEEVATVYAPRALTAGKVGATHSCDDINTCASFAAYKAKRKAVAIGRDSYEATALRNHTKCTAAEMLWARVADAQEDPFADDADVFIRDHRTQLQAEETRVVRVASSEAHGACTILTGDKWTRALSPRLPFVVLLCKWEEASPAGDSTWYYVPSVNFSQKKREFRYHNGREYGEQDYVVVPALQEANLAAFRARSTSERKSELDDVLSQLQGEGEEPSIVRSLPSTGVAIKPYPVDLDFPYEALFEKMLSGMPWLEKYNLSTRTAQEKYLAWAGDHPISARRLLRVVMKMRDRGELKELSTLLGKLGIGTETKHRHTDTDTDTGAGVKRKHEGKSEHKEDDDKKARVETMTDDAIVTMAMRAILGQILKEKKEVATKTAEYRAHMERDRAERWQLEHAPVIDYRVMCERSTEWVRWRQIAVDGTNTVIAGFPTQPGHRPMIVPTRREWDMHLSKMTELDERILSYAARAHARRASVLALFPGSMHAKPEVEPNERYPDHLELVAVPLGTIPLLELHDLCTGGGGGRDYGSAEGAAAAARLERDRPELVRRLRPILQSFVLRCKRSPNLFLADKVTRDSEPDTTPLMHHAIVPISRLAFDALEAAGMTTVGDMKTMPMHWPSSVSDRVRWDLAVIKTAFLGHWMHVVDEYVTPDDLRILFDGEAKKIERNLDQEGKALVSGFLIGQRLWDERDDAANVNDADNARFTASRTGVDQTAWLAGRRNERVAAKTQRLLSAAFLSAVPDGSTPEQLLKWACDGTRFSLYMDLVARCFAKGQQGLSVKGAMRAWIRCNTYLNDSGQDMPFNLWALDFPELAQHMLATLKELEPPMHPLTRGLAYRAEAPDEKEAAPVVAAPTSGMIAPARKQKKTKQQQQQRAEAQTSYAAYQRRSGGHSIAKYEAMRLQMLEAAE